MTARELTETEKTRVIEYREQCIKHVFQTTPLDRQKAENAIHRLYRANSLNPTDIRWVEGGPYSAFLLMGMLVLDEDDLRISQLANLPGGGSDQFLIEIAKAVIEKQALDPAVEQILGSQGQADIRKSVSQASYFGYCSGQQELLWSAYYSLAREFGVVYPDDVDEKVSAVVEVGLECSYFWPFHELVVACERPSTFMVDEEYRLHAATGPCVQFPGEDFQIFSWHGVVFPQDPDTYSALDIQKISNTEVRRSAIERVGWAEFLDGIHATPVDVADDPGNWITLPDGSRAPRQLRLYELPDDPDSDARLLVMENGSPDRRGTDRVYGEMVPRTCATALEAVCWQFGTGVTPETYSQLVRRT